MLVKFSKNKWFKVLAVYLAVCMLVELFLPTVAYALTGGPSQPEVQDFQPIGTTDMVDLFTGDFSYNIPLMDVGGYPINLSYQAGVGMDQEASWVGLGWSVNPGAIIRNMRGIPDEFNGEEIIKNEVKLKPNETWGGFTGLGFEIFGLQKTKTGTTPCNEPDNCIKLHVGLGANYNNYVGVGVETSVNAALTSSKKGGYRLDANLGISGSSEGSSLNGDVSYSNMLVKKTGTSLGGNFGFNYNSRAGLKQIDYGLKLEQNFKFKEKITKKNEVKQRGLGIGIGGSSTISFNTPTFTPDIQQSMLNVSRTYKVTYGFTAKANDYTLDLGGYYSKQKVKDEVTSLPAYGYQNSQDAFVEGDPKKDVLHDFNREKDGVFSKNTPNLPLTNYTYDVYSITGQGISGSFRPFRSDVGYVYDNEATSKTIGGSGGLEGAAGDFAHVGADVVENRATAISGVWYEENKIADYLGFIKGAQTLEDNPTTPHGYETFYFKQMGELSVDEGGLYERYQQNRPVAVELERPAAFDMYTNPNFFIFNNYDDLANPQTAHDFTRPLNFKSSRAKRNQVISYLNIAEAKVYGLQPELYDDLPSCALNHHIGEITVTRDDGARYYYGLPSYTLLQEEVSFNVASRNGDCGTGQVFYEDGDNSQSNEQGIDNYYFKSTMPGYASSYLLTSVVSSDYVDSDDEPGPSPADYGSYTLFEYYKHASATAPYNWRSPANANAANLANYDKGLNSIDNDDRGSYVYGQKEIQYLKTIKTKTHVAVFVLNNETTDLRHDGWGVNDENGGAKGKSLRKLDRIELYARPDYEDNFSTNQATPIKVVHFTYDYSRCPGIPNGTAGGGKLTLRDVYYTYGKINTGRFGRYHFDYSSQNPSYNSRAMDRWGNYKPNNSSGCGESVGLTNAEFPYAEQNSTLADQYAQAWNLTKISLPSGGEINVEYEADDYAYVQDKQAMQMVKLIGCTVRKKNDEDAPPDDEISTGAAVITTGIGDLMNQNALVSQERFFYMYFDMESGTDIEQYFNETVEEFLYFKFLVDITGYKEYEYVPGYAQVAAKGKVNGSNTGWIRLENVNMEIGPFELINSNANPITRTAIQFGRLYMPRKVWRQPDIETSTIDAVLDGLSKAIVGTVGLDFITSPNQKLYAKNCGKTCIPSQSYIRLLSPNKIKKGGGCRVKKLFVDDRWGEMGGGGTVGNSYGKEYSYTLTENGKEISSGVSAYEPYIGGDEIPFRLPVKYNIENGFAPDDKFYQEEPFGESFFPSANVGYSMVTVKDIKSASAAKVPGRGKEVYEFYTQKDFPTIAKRTKVQNKHNKTSPLLKLFKLTNKEYRDVSQGFVIELNDMHGKVKAQRIYGEGKVDAISEVEYYYKTNSQFQNRLDNEVKVIFKNDCEGSECPSVHKFTALRNVGVEMDLIADFRESSTEISSIGGQGNLALFYAGAPVFIPTLFPKFTKEETRFRSASMTKVVHRTGILEEVVKRDLKSEVRTKNLAFDAETGQVILTKTINQFDDDIYAFSYPAYWAYDGMGLAYKNIGLVTSVETDSDGEISEGGIGLVSGDELATNTDQKAWVVGDDPNHLMIVNASGNPRINYIGNVKVIRSGRRNMQSLSMGSVITRKISPLKDVGGIERLVFENVNTTTSLPEGTVLSAQAIQYKNDWGTYCDCIDYPKSIISYKTIHDIDEDPPGSDGLNKCYISIDNLYNPSAVVSFQWYYNGSPISGANKSILPTPSLSGTYYVNVVYQNGCSESYDSVPIEFTVQADCGDSNTPTGTEGEAIAVAPGLYPDPNNPANPYLHGLRGNWRPVASYLYLAERSQTLVDFPSGGTPTDRRVGELRNDGGYITLDSYNAQTTFKPFWGEPVSNDANWTRVNNSYWTFTSEVTQVSPFGNEQENKDALFRYSSALFGYANTLPIAVASNAKHREIAYDGFEDYDFNQFGQGIQDHFSFQNSDGAVSSFYSHSGRYSFKLDAGSTSYLIKKVQNFECESEVSVSNGVDECDCISGFSPTQGVLGEIKDAYVLNAWVFEDENSTSVGAESDPDFDILINGTPISATTLLSEPIEGWRRLEMKFTLTSSNELKLVLRAGNHDSYFDDIRISPFNSTMKSFVYDPISLRVMAELDENNYATFYEYDEEGALARIKKETERGIMTIQEVRQSSVKNQVVTGN